MFCVEIHMPAADGFVEFWEQRYLQSYGLMMIERGGFGEWCQTPGLERCVQGKSWRTFQSTLIDNKSLRKNSLVVNVSTVEYSVSTNIPF